MIGAFLGGFVIVGGIIGAFLLICVMIGMNRKPKPPGRRPPSPFRK